MTELTEFREQDRPVRTVDRDEGVEFVVDLEGDADGAAVDVVDDVAIVVTDDDQFEVGLPTGDSEAFIRNGVLTIRTEDTA